MYARIEGGDSTEPDCWSWEQQTANKGLSVWDGVRNHQAQKAMKNMLEGDLCFFYHTGKLKEVCGIVRVVREYYPDPTDETGKWGAVDVQEVFPLKKKVTLAEMKDDDEISDFMMFRQPRLSVVPVEEKVWTRVLLFAAVCVSAFLGCIIYIQHTLCYVFLGVEALGGISKPARVW
ncbi:hypothetical protein R1flu_021754 [Riccia fluitans]|uniref:EVE domain-containing protein n=1 Tax=Riccia fluitans TaxID=41844 RepID=A0ABD1ZQA0_9MARC